MRETDLYAPVKAFLVAQGYDVKAEVNGCDLVACRGDEAPVVVELKRAFSIALLLQGVDRQAISDTVYIAVPRSKTWSGQVKDAVKLCRRLGLGILSVRLRDGFVEAHCDPAPYQPRKFKKRTAALLREFKGRVGDPNIGGQVGRKIITAYRQDVQRIAAHISEHGPTKPAALAKELGISKAASILQKDYYGWFFRVERGVYDLSEGGQAEVKSWT